MSQSILGTDPTLLVCRLDKHRDVIGKTDCLGVAAINKASMPTYTQTHLNTSNVALRPLKALSSLSWLFSLSFSLITPQISFPADTFLSVWQFYPKPLNFSLALDCYGFSRNNLLYRETNGVSFCGSGWGCVIIVKRLVITRHKTCPTCFIDSSKNIGSYLLCWEKNTG